MYTHFNNLCITKKVDSALLNTSNVQTVHQQHPCVVDNLQHSGILLVLLAVEGRQFLFFSLMLHVAVFLVFFRTQCSAEYTTSKV